MFIDKVRAIVLNNLPNDKFGVGELNSELGLPKSQTLRKVEAASIQIIIFDYNLKIDILIDYYMAFFILPWYQP